MSGGYALAIFAPGRPTDLLRSVWRQTLWHVFSAVGSCAGSRAVAGGCGRQIAKQDWNMAPGDFAQKLGVVLKAINLSRGRLAQTIGVDKSVVSRWASAVQTPSDQNLSLLTEA